MKKVIILLIVFLGVNLITPAGNHDLSGLNALPGMPVLHKDVDNQSANGRKSATDADMTNIFEHNDADGFQGYPQNDGGNGNRFTLLPGNMNSSHWLQKKVVLKGYRAAEDENHDFSKDQDKNRDADKIAGQNNSCGKDQKMMVAHKAPSIIFHLNRKCKVRSYMISMQVNDNKNGHDLIRNMDAKITAKCNELNIMYHSNALKRNPKQVCVIVIDAALGETEKRETENNTATNTGLEFILPQRI